MRKFLFLATSIILISSSLAAQTSKELKGKLTSGQEFFANKDYKNAKKIYSELLSSDKENPEYNFYTGICELYTDQEDNAMKRFDLILNDYEKNGENNFTKSAIFYKAKAFHNIYKFDEEIKTLKKLSAFELTEKQKKEMETAITNSRNAKSIFLDFKPIIVTRLDILNSGYDDHTPIPTSNGSKLYFTSKRPGGVSGKTLSDEGKYYEDIWLWNGSSEPVNIGTPVNTLQHDATGGLSLDGKTIFIYKASEDKLGDIYKSSLENNKWTTPTKLGKNINKKNSIERHAALSPDGKKLYFSSDRKGGKGGRDIWVSELQEDGEWGEAKNLEINTEFDEESPYILSDGKTFYFSSKGHIGMGGYDIFKCNINEDGSFTNPTNIGFPINTVEDDVFYFPLSDEQTAYFTRRKSDNAEIFKTIFPENTLIVESDVKGKEVDKDLYPIEKSTVTVFDINSNIEPDAYTLNLEKGKYKTVVVHNKDYKFYYQAPNYVFDTENISREDTKGIEFVEKDPILVKIETGKTEKFKNTSFIPNSTDFNKYTKSELDLIIDNLKKYSMLVVNFSTENYEKPSSNLSITRKNKAVEYLKDNGISPDRIFLDLSDRIIPQNSLEYTIYDIESVKKAIKDKEDNLEVITIAEKEYVIEIENVFFNFDKSKMQIAQNNKIDLLAKYLSDNPNAKIAVIGYTDAVGTRSYNDKLSSRRAKTVKKYLTDKGAKENQIDTYAFGEDNPYTFNKKNGRFFEPSKKFNRRVEFMVVIQGNPKLKIVQFKEVPEEYKEANYNANYKR